MFSVHNNVTVCQNFIRFLLIKFEIVMKIPRILQVLCSFVLLIPFLFPSHHFSFNPYLAQLSWLLVLGIIFNSFAFWRSTKTFVIISETISSFSAHLNLFDERLSKGHRNWTPPKTTNNLKPKRSSKIRAHSTSISSALNVVASLRQNKKQLKFSRCSAEKKCENCGMPGGGRKIFEEF